MRARGKIALSVAAVLVAASLVPASASSPTVSTAPCAAPQMVQNVGPACTRPDGLLQLTLEDGTSLITHGADYIVPNHGGDKFLKLKPKSPSCVKDPRYEPHIQMIYSSGTDRPNNYAKMLYTIRKMVGRMNAMLDREAGFFGLKMRYRMACSKGQPSVINVPLNLNHDSGDYFNVVTAVRRQGYTNPLAKYWIFYDDFYGPLGGVATLLPDDSLSSDNASNFGPAYGVFYGYTNGFGHEALMHEGAHNLGAVQNSAPNTTGNGHCIDDSDVMCYPDGGPLAANFQWNVCAEIHFDCKNDDYFNPRPKKGSYLATHWNLASPLNRYFAGCTYKIGSLTVGTAGNDVDQAIQDQTGDWSPIAATTVSIPKACRKHLFALTGFVSRDQGPIDRQLGLVPDLTLVGVPSRDALIARVVQPDFNVCFLKGSKVLKCFTADGTDQGTVPGKANKARIAFFAGAQGQYVLNVV